MLSGSRFSRFLEPGKGQVQNLGPCHAFESLTQTKFDEFFQGDLDGFFFGSCSGRPHGLSHKFLINIDQRFHRNLPISGISNSSIFMYIGQCKTGCGMREGAGRPLKLFGFLIKFWAKHRIG